MVFPGALMGPQWAQGGTSQAGFALAVAASTVVLTVIQQFLFKHLTGYIERLIRSLINSQDPFVHIKFQNDTGQGGPKNGQAYAAIEAYLSARCTADAIRLKANAVRDIRTPVLCLDAGEGVSDEFKGVKVSWQMNEEKEKGDEYRPPFTNKCYILSFRKTNRELVVGEYVGHVMSEGKSIRSRRRHLRLYSNNMIDPWWPHWNHIMDLDHPATFDTIAMPEEKKKEIIDDVMRFSNGRDYYKQIGKPWKRGYLLYGPPGTGKSTMIAAMANLLNYDIYDLELTAVISNAALKKLLVSMPGNSILVMEDIDCSSKITGQREAKPEDGNKIIEKVTLSGLLNCLDGIFSANEGGRLIVFTTNHIENLDQALVRRGRMDKRIEMSYCGFESCKVLARNYLGIEEHELFPKIRELLAEIEVTPADVAENLIRKEVGPGSGGACLRALIDILEKKKKERKSNDPRAGKGEELGGEPESGEAGENGTWERVMGPGNGHLD